MMYSIYIQLRALRVRVRMCVCEVFANGDCAAVKGCVDSSRSEKS